MHGYRVQASGTTASSGERRKFAFELLPPEPRMRHFHFYTDSENDRKRYFFFIFFGGERKKRAKRGIRREVTPSTHLAGCCLVS